MLLVAPAMAYAKTTVVGSGSVAFSPFLLAAFAKYEKVTKGQVEVVYNVNSGNNGVKDVQSGKSQFAGQARAPLPNIDNGTTYYKTAKDGQAIIVSKAIGTKVKNLSLTQLGDIFSGKITNWSQVGGPDATIEVNGRDASGGQYQFFRDAVLGGKDLQVGAKHPNDGLVATAVGNSKTGIGYLGVGFIKKTTKYKLISLNKVPLTKETVKKGKYPLWRFLYLVLPNEQARRTPEVLKLVNWLLYSYDAGQAFSKAGAVPYKQSLKKPKKAKKSSTASLQRLVTTG
jgi:phosphate transport system substrate-binding protein